jgi:hypothetical protein
MEKIIVRKQRKTWVIVCLTVCFAAECLCHYILTLLWVLLLWHALNLPS